MSCSCLCSVVGVDDDDLCVVLVDVDDAVGGVYVLVGGVDNVTFARSIDLSQTIQSIATQQFKLGLDHSFNRFERKFEKVSDTSEPIYLLKFV